MRLAVELAGTRLGTLEGDPRSFDFTLDAGAVGQFGSNSSVLSVSVPIVDAPRRDQAALRRNWFAELLPEGDQYQHMLAQASLRPGDTLGFLARYGRDVAGALQIWDLDDPTEPKEPALRPLTAPEVRDLLLNPVSAPLANDAKAGKTSLGGVQPKIALVSTDRGWGQALGGYPTTHILKPRLDAAPSVIFDEEYGARLSRRLGLATHSTEVRWIDGLAALVIERFDRRDGQRIHQEDFNQVLGAAGNQKYQRIGGRVTLARVARVLRQHAPASELRRLARMVVVAVALGNLDMHAKNLGLLHVSEDEVRLAPAYDVVPMAHLPGDGEMALAVGGQYRHAAITRDHLIGEVGGWGVRAPATVVDEALAELNSAAREETPLSGAFSGLQEQILTFTRNLQMGDPVGAEVAGL